MPELPDVETFRRLVQDHCRGRRIAETEASDAKLLDGITAPTLARRLKGERIRSATRHGKHLLILLDAAGALAMHFGMNGSLAVVPRGGKAPPYTRLYLGFEEGDGLAYLNPRRIGSLGLAESVDAFVAQSELGPDALDPSLDLRAFKAMLHDGKREVKTVLMDQALIAGIGNIYSDEILFQARLFPGAAANALDDKSATRLFHAMRETLETAIRCEAGAEHGTERLPKGFLLPERHRGGHCPRCGGPLATAKHSGRTSYFCPRCQPK
jgi:formamidopyrimidine-DNA glycosylase